MIMMKTMMMMMMIMAILSETDWVRNDKWTVLMEAASFGQTEVVIVFIIIIIIIIIIKINIFIANIIIRVTFITIRLCQFCWSVQV